MAQKSQIYLKELYNLYNIPSSLDREKKKKHLTKTLPVTKVTEGGGCHKIN